MAQWIGEAGYKVEGQWIGMGESYKVGEVGFLLSVKPDGGCERYDLRDRPAHTNRSHEPKLTGWCGTTNDVAVYAEGIARVVRVARNGRALVVALSGADLAAALEELGYPDLMPASEEVSK